MAVTGATVTPDGIVFIDTKIDTKGFNAGAKKIEKSASGALNNILFSVAKIGTAFKKMLNPLSLVKNAIQSIGKLLIAAFIGGEILGFFRQIVQEFDIMGSAVGEKFKPLTDALETLKGAFVNLLVQAIIPLIPYLVQFVNWLITVVQTVTQVVAALFGFQSTVGNIMTKAASDTKKAAKEAKGALAAFDQINVLQKQEAPETPEGGALATPGPLEISPEAQRIADEILKIIQKIKDIWEDILAGDWSGAGQKFLDFVYWEEWKRFFMGLWTEITNWFKGTDIGKLVITLWENMVSTWKKIFENTKETLAKIKENVLLAFQGIKDFITGVFTGDWELAWQGLKDIVAGVFGALGALVEGLLNNISIFLEGWGNTLQIIFGPVLEWLGEMFEKVKAKVTEAIAGISAIFSNLAAWFLTNVWNPIEGGFGSMVSGIKKGFQSAFEGIKGIVKGIINNIIDFINRMIDGVVFGINTVIGAANAIAELGGFPAINYVDAPRIPKLATGAVIPPNSEFLAIMGDQKSGTNIEAPADLIRQIVREEVARVSGEVNVTMPVYLDGEKIYQNQKRVSSRHGTSLIKSGATA